MIFNSFFLGYDWDGNQISKPETGDQLDNFLKKMEDPDFWRTVKDPQTGQDVVLSDEDVQLIRRIRSQKIPDISFDEYAVRIYFNFNLFSTHPTFFINFYLQFFSALDWMVHKWGRKNAPQEIPWTQTIIPT